jgi:hypothetical protein
MSLNLLRIPLSYCIFLTFVGKNDIEIVKQDEKVRQINSHTGYPLVLGLYAKIYRSRLGTYGLGC